MLPFTHPNKPINYGLKLKMVGKKIMYSSVKYLGILIDSHSKYHSHVNELPAKLTLAIGMLTKMRCYIEFKT